MDNNITQYYKNIDEPIINNIINNVNLKNLLALSTVTDLYLFRKDKRKWKLKDKREILKECNIIKKKTIKEVSTSLNTLIKNKSVNITKEIKNKSDHLLHKVENIDTIIETIEKEYPESDYYYEVYSN
jgi:hypothetical protein